MNVPSAENAKPEEDSAETKNAPGAESAKPEEGSAETRDGSSAENAPEGSSEKGYEPKAKQAIGAGYLNSQLFERNYYSSLSCVQNLKRGSTLEGHHSKVFCLNFHLNGELLASGSTDRKLIVWDFKKPEPLPLITTDTGKSVHDCKLLPLTGEIKIASTNSGGKVILSQIDQAGPVLQSELGGIDSAYACRKLAVYHDEPQSILSIGLDGYILHHHVRKGSEETLLRMKGSITQYVPLYSISSHPLDSNKFCVAGKDHQVRVYDRRKITSSCDSPHSIYHPFETLNSVRSNHTIKAVYNYNGTEIVAAYNFDDIYLFKSTSTLSSYTRRFKVHRTIPTLILRGLNFFGPKSEFIVSDTNSGVIAFWDKSTGSLVQELDLHTPIINTIENHPTKPVLCASGKNSRIETFIPNEH